MNGLLVGRLERLPGRELALRYAPEWLDRGARAVPLSLSLPLSPDPHRGEHVWAWFDNLLPDTNDLRTRLRAVLGADSTAPFDLLAAMGADCVGAIQLFPDDELPDVRRVDASPLSASEIASMLRAIPMWPLGLSAERRDFRISVAGAQEKTALLRHGGRWCRPRGATPTSHLFKLPIGPTAHGIDLSDSVENEWLCSRIAQGFGLEVARAEIESFEEQKVLIVERFDRRWSPDGSWLIRLPQEDFCQALSVPPAKKYEADGGPGIGDGMRLLLQSRRATEDRRVFFRAQVVFWMLAAIDGHAKNFSLFLYGGGRSALTPLYDVLSAHPGVARGDLAPQELSMAMALTGKNRHYRWSEILPRHWRSTAKAARFSESEAAGILAECVELAEKVVERIGAELPPGFPSEVAEPVLEGVSEAAARLGRGLG